MKIEKVSIVIESIDEENASVKLVTDPIPSEGEEIEDSPAVNLGATLWDLVQQFLEYDNEVTMEGRTLQ
jgi:hypothetical protein